jgi:hypothetical protein
MFHADECQASAAPAHKNKSNLNATEYPRPPRFDVNAILSYG